MRSSTIQDMQNVYNASLSLNLVITAAQYFAFLVCAAAAAATHKPCCMSVRAMQMEIKKYTRKDAKSYRRIYALPCASYTKLYIIRHTKTILMEIKNKTARSNKFNLLKKQSEMCRCILFAVV